MFSWLFGGKLRRKINRDEIKAAADDEVWRFHQSAVALKTAMDAAMDRDIEKSIRGYVEGKTK